MNKKESRFAVGIWLFIGIVIILSNNVIEFLSHFGMKSETANLMIVVGVILLAFYHEKIAKELATIV